MQMPVLMDKLSEFLMVEQGGLELYRVAASRCTNPMLKQRYETFAKETAHHREVLVRLIERLGGDPSYVSPTARIAQYKAAKLLESSLVVDGLSQQEIEMNDLENLLLAETKDHADWSLLQQLAKGGAAEAGVVGAVKEAVQTLAGQSSSGGSELTEVQQAIQQAVKEVEHEEDEHVSWARNTLSMLASEMVLKGPAPSPERWQRLIAGDDLPFRHPAPLQEHEGLMPTAMQPSWQPTPIVRAVRKA